MEKLTADRCVLPTPVATRPILRFADSIHICNQCCDEYYEKRDDASASAQEQREAEETNKEAAHIALKIAARARIASSTVPRSQLVRH